jgi:hypothetical protein
MCGHVPKAEVTVGRCLIRAKERKVLDIFSFLIFSCFFFFDQAKRRRTFHCPFKRFFFKTLLYYKKLNTKKTP